SAGIKAIAGAELNVDGHPTAFLARDQRGYRNLATLVTRSRMGELRGWGAGKRTSSPGVGGWRGREGKAASPSPSKYAVPFPERGMPGVTFEDVANHAEGLYCLTGPAAGEVATYVRSGRTADAMFLLDRWRDVFGSRLAVEVQLHHAGG